MTGNGCQRGSFLSFIFCMVLLLNLPMRSFRWLNRRNRGSSFATGTQGGGQEASKEAWHWWRRIVLGLWDWLMPVLIQMAFKPLECWGGRVCTAQGWPRLFDCFPKATFPSASRAFQLPPQHGSTHLGMSGLFLSPLQEQLSQKSFCLEQLPRQLGKPMLVCSCVSSPKSNTQP